MARGSSAWHSIVTAELKKVGKGAKPKERGEAMKRASRIYHGKKLMSNPGPAKGNIIKMGLIAAAAFVGLKVLGNAQASAAPATGGGCSKCSAGATTGTSNGSCALKV